jgi:hypothetical protein
MIDCIGGYHQNPWTCGTAKFSAIPARHLDVLVRLAWAQAIGVES